jgi:hypothetical protein
MNTGLRHLRAFVVSCLGVLASICCVAGQVQQPQEKTSAVQVNVNRVLVPVVVRDAQGRAVGNLTREDFQVLDDDKSRPISGFSAEAHGPEVFERRQCSQQPTLLRCRDERVSPAAALHRLSLR